MGNSICKNIICKSDEYSPLKYVRNAAQKGYRYVFSSADGTGNSIIIVAPEADDLTQEVMEYLGIELK